MLALNISTASQPLWIGGGVLVGVIVTAALGLIGVALKNKNDRKIAESQEGRDRRKHLQTLKVEKLEAAYTRLTRWVSRVMDTAEGICNRGTLEGLKPEDHTPYGVCVHLRDDLLRIPEDTADAQWMWSPRVAELVELLQQQAVDMATANLIHGKGPDEDGHGHDEMKAIKVELFALMQREIFELPENTVRTSRS
ncbi:hypothetical protein Cme02nite_45160 [Catellatospora methionotrophica]|uniref:Uncharacterized protein n=1 Tax=Catellatospora methionotrophica TaxID=121620 RepID=A0A8J3LCV3_9ACTN|nr:hypothetical protein [Catellatospora methionotrophica]GIG16184.1 hypothetical protein Cme02nite_45160 [Catellatospora methionotrophica]